MGSRRAAWAAYPGENHMPLKAIHDTIDEIDEAFRPLYTERNGKFELTGVEGVKTQADIDRVTGGLTKERNDHNALKTRFQPLLNMDVAEVVAKLDKFPELEAAAAGNIDEKKLDELASKRVDQHLAPVKRENETLKTANETLKAENEALKTSIKQRDIREAVSAALVKAKVVDTAHEDALLLANSIFEIDESGRVITKADLNGVTPGLEPSAWLTDMQPKRPHWWPASQGGGGQGGGGNGGLGGPNPFSHEGWNFTEQSRLARTDPQRADQLAKQAGTTVGGPKPAPKKAA